MAKIILQHDGDLTAQEVEDLRYLLSDALLDFARPRADVEAYLDKRYPKDGGLGETWRATKRAEIGRRVALAQKLHNAALSVVVAPDEPAHDEPDDDQSPDENNAQPDPVCVIVLAYQTDDQRFWSGRKWVQDPSDAAEYTDFAKARRSWAHASGGGDLVYIVENYGLATERVAFGEPEFTEDDESDPEERDNDPDDDRSPDSFDEPDHGGF